MKRRIDVCLNCGGELDIYMNWCNTCWADLTPKDKWYVIGFKDAGEMWIHAGMKDVWWGERKAGFDMGVADRKGPRDE